MNKVQLLFIIILVEGYAVLATELLAIRQLVPFVGSGTETVSIIISAVLLPLAIGYHAGGNAFSHHYGHSRKRDKSVLSVRKLLLRNIVTALTILSIGMSYVFMELFFAALTWVDITHRLIQTALYSVIFLVYPIFLLGQTVPLVSNYFSRRRLSEITGKMLFFSTAGSFLGSVFSTIVLMTFIGVHNTVIVTMGLLCLLILLLVRRLFVYESFFALFVFSTLLLINGNTVMDHLHIVSNNAYNIISVMDIPEEDARIFNINRSTSSKISKDNRHQFPYWDYIQAQILDPITHGKEPKDILVLGAGGFTIGLDDTFNHYVYVDIDKALKDMTEKHFLGKKLTPNKEFIPASARAFVHSHTKKYDFILIDVYTNMVAISQETTTREFLRDTKKLLKENGVLAANVVSTADFREKFTVRYDNTFSSVFPIHTRQIIGPFNAWPNENSFTAKNLNNVLYIYFNHPLVEDNALYTDDVNSYSFDRN